MTQFIEKLYTESQVAEICSISLSKLRKDRHMRKGIPFVKISSSVRYKQSDINNFLKAHTVNTTEDSHDVHSGV